jgi:hypothetical protein
MRIAPPEVSFPVGSIEVSQCIEKQADHSRLSNFLGGMTLEKSR